MLCKFLVCTKDAEPGKRYCKEHAHWGAQRVENGIKKGVFSYEDEIYCPHCGAVNTDNEHEFMEEGEHETECTSCGKPFTIDVSISRHYTTTTIDDEEDKEEEEDKEDEGDEVSQLEAGDRLF